MQLFQQKMQDLSTQEAYNLWDALKTRYDTIELIHIVHNFIHDKDFKLLASSVMLNTLQEQANLLEKKMSEFQLALPKRPAKSVRTVANTEVLEDRFLAGLLMTILQENIGLHMRAVRNSLVNENIRDLFKNLLKQEVNIYTKGIKYVKLKGWVETPPVYPWSVKEKIDSGEAYHLWDHLASRYDNLEMTMVFSDYAHDPDFKALLFLGKRSLQKQVKVLEDEMDHFGLPLPQRPPEEVNTGENPTALNDEMMFRSTFTGMQYMMDLHSIAIKQSTTNDRLRAIYLDFIDQELAVLDSWIKYGKIKGWLRPAPMLKQKNKGT